MNKLDLNSSPISITEGQLEREFINIFEQLTGLKFQYYSKTKDETSFCFRVIGKEKITDKTVKIIYIITSYCCCGEWDDNEVLIHIDAGLKYRSRKMFLYQVIGNLLSRYVKECENNGK